MKTRFLVVAVLAISGCNYISESTYDERVDLDGDGVPFDEDCAPDDPDRSFLVDAFEDADGDGFGGAPIVVCGALDGVTELPVGGDCDDTNPDVSPLADEICNGVDDDCDGVFDADDPGLIDGTAFYTDADGDGTPAPGGMALVRCEAPAGRAVAPSDGVWDCDDGNDEIGPSAVELCDGIDNDCVGGVDDGLPPLTSYVDVDLDGFGTVAQVVVDCEVPPGFSLLSTDCDDGNEAISPAAAEICANAVDEDCDGLVDEEGGALLRYRDADLDGFSAGDSAMLCELPGPGWLSDFDPDAADCDDADSTRFPGAPDVPYDGRDSDCAGDDDYDADGDGVQREPEGLDCDDTDPTTYPGAPDAPYDGIDSDCADDNDDDADGDGFTAAAEGGGDCDDTDADVRPNAVETYYDGVDQNCDGEDDYDADGDGYAPDAWAGLTALPTGDCDDLAPTRFPGAVDLPYDGVDSDCVGDDDFDVDGDGHAPPSATNTPLPKDDCNDTEPAIHGGADELCNAVDDDCDSLVDEPGATGPGALQSLVDGDLDGAPGATVQTVCAFASGFIDPALALVPDCDDADPTSYPGAVEVPDDGIDQDCDGPDAVRCFQDLDLDGIGGLVRIVVPEGNCAAPGLATTQTDCDDTDPEVYPGAVELCDTVNQDCSGTAATGLISGRLATDGSGVVLWPGPLMAGAAFDLTPYREISVCGDGPWVLPPLAGTGEIDLVGVTSPAPTLEFVGPATGVDIQAVGDVALSNLRFVATGVRDQDDLPLVTLGLARVQLTDVELDGVVGRAGVMLDAVENGEISGSSLHDGEHRRAPLVAYDSGPVVMTDSAFSDNSGGYAGGLESSNTSWSMGEVVFERNTSTTFGGAVRLEGTSVLDVSVGSFEANWADEAGAIYVGPGASLQGDSMSFLQNTATRGGALMVHGFADLFDMGFNENSAIDAGGAILVERCGTVGGCTEPVNTQPVLLLEDATLADNTAVDGGGLLVDGGSALMSEISASRNTVTGRGGHIHARNLAQVNLAQATLVDGRAYSGGGAAFEDSFATLAECTIENNTSFSYGGGGGLWGTESASVTVDLSVVRGNSTTLGSGGGAYVLGQLNVRETVFESNTARQSGGGAYAVLFNGFDVTFNANIATNAHGGGLRAAGQCDECSFSNNTAGNSGGGLYVNGDPYFSMYIPTFDSNTAATGGAVYGSLEMVDGTFIFNLAYNDGGALFHVGDDINSYGGTQYLYNAAGGRGGAVYTAGTYLENFSNFEGNTASQGAAVWVDGGLYVDYDSTYSGNSASLGDLAYVEGSGEIDITLAVPLSGAGTVFAQTQHPLPDGTDYLYCSSTFCTCLPNPCP